MFVSFCKGALHCPLERKVSPAKRPRRIMRSIVG
jgi:hypothetical protein